MFDTWTSDAANEHGQKGERKEKGQTRVLKKKRSIKYLRKRVTSNKQKDKRGYTVRDVIIRFTEK